MLTTSLNLKPPTAGRTLSAGFSKFCLGSFRPNPHCIGKLHYTFPVPLRWIPKPASWREFFMMLN